MNIIDTSLISDPSKQQPFLGGSLAFLQNSSKEMIVGICRSIMGETLYANASTVAVVMSGCTFNSTLDTIFNGYIFFNGELYYFPGKVGLNAFAIAPVVTLNTTYLSPDPITFSDSSTGSVHAQRRLQCVDATLGSGLFNLKDMVYVSQNTGTSAFLGSYSTSGSTQENVTGATFTTPKGLTGMTRKYIITFFGNVQYYILNGAAAGCKLAIRNSTTSTDLAANFVDSIGTAGTAGLTLQTPFSIQIKATLAQNTTIVGTIQRTGSVNNPLQNGYWLVEEYND
jgi:hypothetical protein